MIHEVVYGFLCLNPKSNKHNADKIPSQITLNKVENISW